MFEKHDDRISSQEAPVSQGFYMDAAGTPLENRPDNVVERYLSKVSLTQDEYWKLREYLDNRQWFELDMYLDKLAERADKDDLARIKNAKQVTRRILGDKNE